MRQIDVVFREDVPSLALSNLALDSQDTTTLKNACVQLHDHLTNFVHLVTYKSLQRYIETTDIVFYVKTLSKSRKKIRKVDATKCLKL